MARAVNQLVRGLPGLLLALLACLALGPAEPADAVILPAQTIDGPSQEIVGFGGVAMAEDGTGGLVYLKRVEGVPHVFVSRYVEGKWLAPIRVDAEQPYAASWPAIGAAENGELIVVWATPYGTKHKKLAYELMGALLGPGGEAFGKAMIVDPDIEEATGTSPDLAVSSTGQADVVYRVVEPDNTSVPLLRTGDVVEQVRLAHFDGERWTDLGAINRNPGVSMRAPTAQNAPKVAIGPTGSGIVVWQEPEIEGVGEIWARRIFGSAIDYVMPVSATTFDGLPISEDAEAPSVAFSRLGQAEVAYRQPAGAGSPLPGPRVYLNILPDGESTSGAEFEGAKIVDNTIAGGKHAVVGPPSIDIEERRNMRMLYDSDGTPRVIEGNGQGLTGALTLGPDFAGGEQVSVSVMNPEGGGVSAWPSADSAGHPAVAVREDFPDGAVQTALVSGGAGGEVTELAVGRSGLGDGIVGFRQGPFGDAAIVADDVTAPPVAALISVPSGWLKASSALITWQPAESADGPLAYHVVLDGRELPTPAGALALRLSPRGLRSGEHRVQILATDRNGQSTLSPPTTIQIDDVPPSVRFGRTRHGTAVSVHVSDLYSGVDRGAIRVSFGDGAGGRGKVSFVHAYAHAGTYLVVVHVRDRIGNAGVIRRWVRVA